MSSDQVYIYGINPVYELLKRRARKIHGIYAVKSTSADIAKCLRLAPSHVAVTYVSKDQLTARVQTHDHQGIVVCADPFPIRKKSFDPAQQPCIMMLDGIQDPRNLGAILRSAACMGISGVILSSKQTAPLNGTVWKASAGLAEHVSIMYADAIVATAKELQAQGYHLYSATMEGADVRTVSIKTPCCLIIGSEGRGLSPQLRAYGTALALPQKDADMSYNASVAAALLMYIVASNARLI